MQSTNLDVETMLTERQVSEILKLSMKKLQLDRAMRQGLPYVRWGTRCIRYRQSDVSTFIKENLVLPKDAA
jgi:hypothetical protein